MRLEILVDSEEPVIYPLNKPEIVIGSGDSCDIILGSSGVSRKHLKVLVEGDAFFVLDQGSTNGTFINEERLVPGRKTEFTSFFPVRLGGRVLLTLLSDEEAHDSILSEFTAPKDVSSAAAPSDSTRVLSLKDIQESSTKKLVKKRQEVVARKKTTKPPIKKAKPAIDLSMLKSILVAIFILGGAIYYNFYIKAPEVVAPAQVIVKPLTEAELNKRAKAEAPPVAPVVENSQMIKEDDLLSASRIKSLFTDLKCLIREELYFCDLLPELKKGNAGVAAIGDAMVFLVEESPWMARAAAEKAKVTLKNTSELDPLKAAEELHKLAFIFYLTESLKPIDMKFYKGKSFYIAFFKDNDKELSVSKVFAFKIEMLPMILQITEGGFFQSYHANGIIALDNLFGLYRSF